MDEPQEPAGGIERIMADRRAKADRLRETGRNPFANDFRPRHSAAEALAAGERTLAAPAEGMSAAEPGPDDPIWSIAGRVVALRSFGKAAFLKLLDRTGRIQVQVRRDVLSPEAFAAFRLADPGDFVGVEGPLFRTRTGEITLLARSFVPLTKAIRPPPEKWHGLSDVETRLRRREVDLFADDDVRRLFRARALIVSALRDHLDRAGFVEVETPMLHAVRGGAAARPFVTHHNVLDIDLFLRVAPELYLKRLLVGGLERVYEIGRAFRNEGISTRHNPEFTILEFYEAYGTVDTVMERTERMLCEVDARLLGRYPAFAERRTVRFERPFRRLPMAEALIEAGVPAAAVRDRDAGALSAFLECAHGARREAWAPLDLGGRLFWLFETLVEPNLGPTPTFVLGYPAAVSPLARPRDADPFWVDRFELFVGGQELANAFSELNDPDVQAERFRAQVEARGRGDDEAMDYDEDYVTALEHGMPPAGGFGLGIDRLVMMLCGVDSIREAILFPLRRPQGVREGP